MSDRYVVKENVDEKVYWYKVLDTHPELRRQVCRCVDRDDAEMVATALNAHNDLVAACKGLLEQYSSMCEYYAPNDCEYSEPQIICEARDALEKAGVK
jgi:hypothetical protein